MNWLTSYSKGLELRADRSCPKVYKSEPFGSRSEPRRKANMKEKNLIETAKMQGNVMVKWLLVLFCMTPMKWSGSFYSSLGSIPFPLNARALAHYGCVWKLAYLTFTFGSSFCFVLSPLRGFLIVHALFLISRVPSLPASRTELAESERIWITVKGVGKFGPVFYWADHNDWLSFGFVSFASWSLWGQR